MSASDERTSILSISAVTLLTHDMRRSVAFYEALGFSAHYGGRDAAFTSLAVGDGFLNLQASESVASDWGRVIFHVGDVDAMYRRCLDAGFSPRFAPRDADWGERYFHINDPDGHELSFAKPIAAT